MLITAQAWARPVSEQAVTDQMRRLHQPGARGGWQPAAGGAESTSPPQLAAPRRVPCPCQQGEEEAATRAGAEQRAGSVLQPGSG